MTNHLKRRPWDKWYWSHWRGSTDLRKCSLAARGLWIEILALMDEENPRGYLPLANQPTELARILGLRPDEDIDMLLWELEQNGVFSRNKAKIIYSRRMIAGELREKNARINGQLGGNPALMPPPVTHSNNKDNPPPVNPPHNPNDNPTHKPHARSLEDREEKEEENPLTPFEEFWNAYPKKNGMGTARRCWQLAEMKVANPADIVAAAAAYARSCRDTEPKFIKAAAKWLDGEHWLDDVAETKPASYQTTVPLGVQGARDAAFGTEARYPDDADYMAAFYTATFKGENE